MEANSESQLASALTFKLQESSHEALRKSELSPQTQTKLITGIKQPFETIDEVDEAVSQMTKSRVPTVDEEGLAELMQSNAN